MSKVNFGDSPSRPRHVRPYGGRSSLFIERRGPRPWSRDRRAAFLHHLAAQDTLDAALAVADVPRVEAFAERMRDRAFARAWDHCVSERLARLPEALLDHVIMGLRAGPDAREATARQAASIGQWLLERYLPALSGAAAPGRAARAAPGAGTAAPTAPDQHGMEGDIASRIAEVRARLARQAGPPAAAGSIDADVEIPDQII